MGKKTLHSIPGKTAFFSLLTAELIEKLKRDGMIAMG